MIKIVVCKKPKDLKTQTKLLIDAFGVLCANEIITKEYDPICDKIVDKIMKIENINDKEKALVTMINYVENL